MKQEHGDISDFIDKIPPYDKEVIVLGTVFFWGKYLRRQKLTDDFQPDVPEVDFNDPISILSAGFSIHRQENADIDGDVVSSVADILSKHPKRSELFGHLTDINIKNICIKLEEIFENQEYCAQCEAWSYYDVDAEDFAIDTTSQMLWIHARVLGIKWFGDIWSGKDRDAIVESVLREILPTSPAGLLAPDYNNPEIDNI